MADLNYHLPDHVTTSFRASQSSLSFGFVAPSGWEELWGKYCRQRGQKTVACLREKAVVWGKSCGMVACDWLDRNPRSNFSQWGGESLCETYAMLLGHGARRGVNNTTPKWDRPNRCLVTNILSRKTRSAFQKGTGAGLMSPVQVSASRKYAKRQQNKAHQGIRQHWVYFWPGLARSLDQRNV